MNVTQKHDLFTTGSPWMCYLILNYHTHSFEHTHVFQTNAWYMHIGPKGYKDGSYWTSAVIHPTGVYSTDRAKSILKDWGWHMYSVCVNMSNLALMFMDG